VQEHYDWYLGRLDGLGAGLTEQQLAEMVEEAKVAFDMNINLNDEVLEVASKL
jgi:heme oxygenase